jgi:hypothetical protein
MEEVGQGSNHELFVILEAFSRRCGDFVHLLAPTNESGLGTPWTESDIYYQRETDVALLALSVSPDTADPARVACLLAITEKARLPVLDPKRLPEADRTDFYETYLKSYSVHIDRCDGPHTALLRLCAELSLDVSESSPEPVQRKRRQSSVPPPIPADAAVDVPFTPTPEIEAEPPPPDAPADPAVRIARASTEPLAPRQWPEPLKTRAKSPPLPSRAQSVDEDAVETAEIEHPPDFESHSETRPNVTGHSLPPIATVVADAETPAVSVRFLRGDRWVTGRVRNLGVRSAHIATAARPRTRDLIPVEFGFRDLRAQIVGQVIEVTHRTDDSPSGFKIMFPTEEGVARRRLIALLMEARAAGITLEPPPVRNATRLPIRLPTRLRTAIGEVAAAALDISTAGLFLATDYELRSDDFSFQIPLDLGGPPLRGRASVVRSVSADTASARGLHRGYGIAITEIGDSERARLEGFLARVEKRIARRVLVVADADRAQELASSLTAVGYAASSYSDPDSVDQLLSTDPHPPDVAVLDQTQTDIRRARWIRRLFERRGVPCISARDLSAEDARQSVDRVLLIER